MKFNGQTMAVFGSFDSIIDDGSGGGYDVYDVTPHYPTFALPAVPNGDYNNATNVEAAYLHNMVVSAGDAFYLKVKEYDKLDQNEVVKSGGESDHLPTITTPSENLVGYYMELSIQSPVWKNLGYQYIDADTMQAAWLWEADEATTIGRLALRERVGKGNVEIKRITYYKRVVAGEFEVYKVYNITPKARFIRLPNMTDTDIADLRNLKNAPAGISYDSNGLAVNAGDAICLEVVAKPTLYNGVDSLLATGEVISELPTVEKTPEPDGDPVYYMDAGIHGTGYYQAMGYQHANPELTYEFLWIAPSAIQLRRITIRERINLLGTEAEVMDFKFYKKRSDSRSTLGAAVLGEMILGDEVE